MCAQLLTLPSCGGETDKPDEPGTLKNCDSDGLRPKDWLVQGLWIDGEFGPHAGCIVSWNVADKQIFASLQIDGQCA